MITERLQLREQMKCEMKSSEQRMTNRMSGADLRFLQECLDTMRAFDNFFMRSYTATPGLPLHQRILPPHREQLKTALQQAFSDNSVEQRATLASMMEPGALEWAGVQLTLQEAKASEQMYCPVRSPLTTDEVIALVDYLHPYTKQFQVINGGARLSTFWGIDGIEVATSLLSSAYLSALMKLARNESFLDRSGVYYKGICLNAPVFASDAQTMDFLAQRSGIVLPPHPLSMTRRRSASFARQPDREENAEAVIRVPTAIDVSLFHAGIGKTLEEVILLPKPLRVISASHEVRFGRRLRIYTLDVIDEPSGVFSLHQRVAERSRAKTGTSGAD